jgi:hypothetical protein
MDEKTKPVSLREMVEAMAHLPDETVFRWYQVSLPGPGWALPGDSLFVTLGSVRKDLGID